MVTVLLHSLINKLYLIVCIIFFFTVKRNMLVLCVTSDGTFENDSDLMSSNTVLSCQKNSENDIGLWVCMYICKRMCVCLRARELVIGKMSAVASLMIISISLWNIPQNKTRPSHCCSGGVCTCIHAFCMLTSCCVIRAESDDDRRIFQNRYVDPDLIRFIFVNCHYSKEGLM